MRKIVFLSTLFNRFTFKLTLKEMEDILMCVNCHKSAIKHHLIVSSHCHYLDTAMVIFLFRCRQLMMMCYLRRTSSRLKIIKNNILGASMFLSFTVANHHFIKAKKIFLVWKKNVVASGAWHGWAPAVFVIDSLHCSDKLLLGVWLMAVLSQQQKWCDIVILFQNVSVGRVWELVSWGHKV